MDISNKEVIDKLTEYFIKQDQKIVARALANCMIDYNRLDVLELLPIEEVMSLKYRVSQIAAQIRNFAKNGSQSEFKLIDINEDILN